ncbi:MAG: VOC family protein, partial [Chloroflexi bacterium]|nr:VOC family protein [Chloroflexota bacterium]
MAANSIHPDTRLGYVHLTVSDLERALRFYQEALGFKVHRREGDTAALGAGRDDLLVLTEVKGARRVPRATGLYHFAILVPSRVELGYALRNMMQHELELGFGDHYVSEAIYLSDPDGNGIEIYRDRPRGEWTYRNGRPVMGTEMVDVRGVLGELQGQPEQWQGLHHDTVLGHMHLQVSDVRAAEAFYRDVIGFDVIANLGSASFVSAGGYHHHLGMNTWHSAGAPPPPPNLVGLRDYTVVLPTADALREVTERVRGAHVPLEQQDGDWLVRDPSQNGVLLTHAQAHTREATKIATASPSRAQHQHTVNG